MDSIRASGNIVLLLLTAGFAWPQAHETQDAVTFREQLAQKTAGLDVDSFDAAKEIALLQAGSKIGVEAVNHLVGESENEDVLRSILLEILTTKSGTIAGARAAELYLARLPTEEALSRSREFQQDFAGTEIEWVAALLALQCVLDKNDLESIERCLLTIRDIKVRHFDAGANRTVEGALDALGYPAEALSFENSESKNEAFEQVAITVGRPGSWPPHCADAIRKMFVSDYLAESPSFEALNGSLANCILSLKSSSETGQVSAGDIDSLVQVIVHGLAFRAKKTNSLVSSDRRQTPGLTATVDACVELMQHVVDSDPELSSVYARAALAHADLLEHAELYLFAERFYQTALTMGKNPETTSTAAVGLARLLSSQWGAGHEAIEVLLEEQARGAGPEVYIASAELMYESGNYEGALLALQNFVRLETDDERIDKANFILGQVLRKLGRENDARAIWLEIRNRTNSDSMRLLLESVLGDRAEVSPP